MKTVETDVLIVGAGPAGAACAAFLSKYDVANLMISRHRSTAESPRAHITNQRTMECLRDAGLERECMAYASPPGHIEHTFWLRSMAGEELARAYSWGNDPERKGDYEVASPCLMCDLPQTRLEPLLVADAARSGSQVRFNTELESFDQDADGVSAAVKDRLTGEAIRIRAKYMVGADGARSRIAEQLKLPLIGKHGLGHAINVLCEIDLSNHVRYRHASLYATIQPGSSIWAPVGVVRMVRPWDQWLVALMVPDAVGVPSLPPKILSLSTWSINDIVAQHYSVGRVFCMGDAVHRHPPTNGLGSNTCVQDAFNLTWKLALVLQGKAGPALLESYNAERQPVGKQVVARANQSMGNNLHLWDLLGAGMRSALAPKEHAKAFDTPGGRTELRKTIESMKFEYHAHGVEMNVNYRSAAIVRESDAIEHKPVRDTELYYEPNTCPGSFLPHAWLGKRTSSPRVSTLDIAGKRRFTLFTGPGGEVWRKAVESATTGLGIDLHAVAIGPYLDYEDLYGRWHRVSGVQEAGCVLVRPDLHIAWRCRNLPNDPTETLDRILRQILAK
jgi:2,4-dichlorophenol 6-monooxygenase